jgi:prepilin-type processing-associated H-X9-DG protein
MHVAIHRRVAGFTVVELMTVILIIMVVMTLLLLGVTAARRSAARAQCINNLRQLGTGVQQYAGRYRVLPSVHTNLWALLGDQLELPGIRAAGSFANNDNSLIKDIYRCPIDMFRPAGTQGCSYAPNCQDASHDSPDEDPTDINGPGRDKYNASYSPWSNFKLDGSQNPVNSLYRLLGTRSLGDAASDTILLIECWDNSNVIDVTGYLNPPRAPITGYLDAAADPTMENSGDAGAYRLLAQFGSLAAGQGRVYTVKNDVYHGGRISVLFADLHTASAEVGNVTHKPPREIPLWTRADD